MVFKAAILVALFCLWLAAGVVLLWLPARLAPPPRSAGPEVSSRWAGPGRRWWVAFGAVSLVLAGAAVGVASVEVKPLTVDFDNDVWVAEYGGSVARNTVRRKTPRSLTLRCGSFTGASTLWRIYDGDGGKEIAIEYQIAVEEGRADLALVRPDGTVTRLSEESSPYVFTAAPGETRLRLIGDGGKVEVSVTIPSRAGNWTDR